MDTLDLFQRLSVALAIGLLIGLERGWKSRTEEEGMRAVGVRTLALSGLLGGSWGAIATKVEGGALALGLAFIAFTAAVAMFRYRELVHDRRFGATTVVAAMVTFSLGAFAVLGDLTVAAAGGVATAALLALKAPLHRWLQRMTWEELRSALLLLAMTFVALPLLPNRYVDPWASLNPYQIWLLTILVAAFSFAGYVAIKAAGEDRGILITGVAGGLVSSTAVTVSLGRLAREHPERTRQLVAGMLLAGATMTSRVLVIAGVVNPSMLTRLALPLLLGGAVQAGGGLLLAGVLDRGKGDGDRLDLKNPFELGTVLKVGALLSLVIVVTKVATHLAGNAGAYLLAALSALVDVDAITLSMARLGAQELAADVALNAILLAVAINTLWKAVLGWMTGGAKAGRLLAALSIAAVGAGLAGYTLGRVA